MGRYYSQHELSGKPVTRNGGDKLKLSFDHILRTTSLYGESFFKQEIGEFCLFVCCFVVVVVVVVVLMTTERQKLKATAGKISNGLIACK